MKHKPGTRIRSPACRIQERERKQRSTGHPPRAADETEGEKKGFFSLCSLLTEEQCPTLRSLEASQPDHFTPIVNDTRGRPFSGPHIQREHGLRREEHLEGRGKPHRGQPKAPRTTPHTTSFRRHVGQKPGHQAGPATQRQRTATGHSDARGARQAASGGENPDSVVSPTAGPTNEGQ